MRRLYWIKEGLKVVVSIFGSAVLYTLLMTLMNTEEADFPDSLQMGAIFCVTIGVMLALLNNMGIHKSLIPLSLSFGGTRKEAIWGIQLYRLTIFLFLPLGATALFGLMLFDLTVVPAVICVVIGVYLIFSGLGGLLGSFASKISKTVFGLIIVFSTMWVIFFSVLAIVSFRADRDIPGILFGVILILGIAVYGIGSIFEVRSIRSHYVR